MNVRVETKQIQAVDMQRRMRTIADVFAGALRREANKKARRREESTGRKQVDELGRSSASTLEEAPC